VTHDYGYMVLLVVLLSQAELSLPRKHAKFWNILEPYKLPLFFATELRSILPVLTFIPRLSAMWNSVPKKKKQGKC
jgi:hypothetical protein